MPIFANGQVRGTSIVRGPFSFNFNAAGLNPSTFAITGVNQGTKTFTIAGNHAAAFPPASSAYVTNSTGNDGTYTVVSATFTASTAIVVVEAIPDATVDGKITAPAAGLAIGYTPAVGDIILGGSIMMTTFWDGFLAKADFGPFVTSTHGWLKDTGVNPVPLVASPGVLDSALQAQPGLGEFGVIVRMTTAEPLKVVVSQDGTASGQAVGGTQGVGLLYLITATPVAFS